ncbi:unnamed protein product [Pieris brassicae]|uniref:IGFBP N-terminal domain-containing protein n=1 Tax=Pieris brassicae TaxID=7116 RepID=A0A9P0XCF7_PIEBR|nr:unnamed protein product [Pieris brassicae]
MLLALAFLSLIPNSAAVVDCRVACRRCREKTDLPEMVEVYCAMCTECKERRIERIQATSGLTTKDDCYPMQEIADCPEQSCEDLEQTQKLPLKKIVTSTTSTTTTRRPCITTPCKKPPPCYCMPFMPQTLCPCPIQSQVTTETINQKLVLPENEKDYTYIYVGVPKDLLNEN